ncbi:MAG: hypothetical protein ACTTKL_05655 [Treponema sp.]
MCGGCFRAVNLFGSFRFGTGYRIPLMRGCRSITQCKELMMTLKTVKTALKAAAVFSFVAYAASCKQNLLSEPDLNKIARSSGSADASFGAPSDVKATSGFTDITIEWNAVSGAKYYAVFSAAEPSDPMERCGETKNGETVSIKITEKDGATKYYAVKAVDYSGKESPLSTKVKGASLARPVISAITPSEDGTSATVNWWLSNCDETTYKKFIRYKVFCFAEDKTTQIGTPLDIADGSTSALVMGLEPKTVYYYQVKAWTERETDGKLERSKELESAKVDAKTLHRLIPEAPLNFSAAKGTAKDGIALRFTLPPFVDVNTDYEVYERHPVYFKIWRKEKGASDSAYEVIAAYLGSKTPTDAAKRIYQFSCKTQTVNTQTTNNSTGKVALAVTEAAAPEKETNGNYPDYVSLSEVTFTDKYNVVRGKEYTYKIQSYVDDVKSDISADKAAAFSEGRLLAVPSFGFTPSYVLTADSQKFTEIKAKFTLDFAEFDSQTEYNFLIKEKFTPAQTGGTTEEKTVLTVSESRKVREYEKSFSGEALKKSGYYQYTLFILPKGETDTTKAYDSVEAAGKLTVTEEAKIPTIENFTVKDGFSDKFELSWKFHKDYNYSLEWKNVATDGTETTGGALSVEELKKLLPTNPTDNTVITCEHSAKSGDCRKYTLTASTVLSKTETGSKVETLGTAKPVQGEIDYDKITVTWDAVQKADSYEVAAFYADEPADQLLTSAGTIADVSGKKQCVITQPAGYNDAAKAGKPIMFRVTAKNTATNSETKAETAVKLLGPALVNAIVDADNITANSITVKWNKVDGASGYLIRRVCYDDGKGQTPYKADTYYYSLTDKKIKTNGDEVDSKRALISESGASFILNDIYQPDETSGTSAFKVNQARIPWGLPYGYAVVPVKSEDDFTFTENAFTVNGGSKVQYTAALASVKGAASGYGIKPAASKLKTSVEVKWEKPFYENFKPSVYRRKAGTQEAWTLLTTLAGGQTAYTDSLKKAEQCAAFEYAVRYDTSGSAPDFAPSYIAELASKKEDASKYKNGAQPEPLNKGYILAADLSAEYGGTVNGTSYKDDNNYYSELVSWKKWDKTVRGIAPDSAELYIYNDDLKNNWIKVADLEGETLAVKTTSSLTDTLIEQPTSASLISLRLKPQGIANGTAQTTDGVLKVLRSPKHYYKIVLKSSAAEAEIGKDRDVFACRQITDEELAKSAMLAFSYAFYIQQGGKEDLSNVGDRLKFGTGGGELHSDNGGTANFSKSYLAWGKYYADFNFENYAPRMLTPSEQKDMFLKLTVPKATVHMYNAVKSYIDAVGADNTNVKVNVSAAEDLKFNNIPMDYSAEISVQCACNWTFSWGRWSKSDIGQLSIKRNNNHSKLLDSTVPDDIRKWIPFQLYDDDGEHFYIKDVSYGWWKD